MRPLAWVIGSGFVGRGAGGGSGRVVFSVVVLFYANSAMVHVRVANGFVALASPLLHQRPCVA